MYDDEQLNNATDENLPISRLAAIIRLVLPILANPTIAPEIRLSHSKLIVNNTHPAIDQLLSNFAAGKSDLNEHISDFAALKKIGALTALETIRDFTQTTGESQIRVDALALISMINARTNIGDSGKSVLHNIDRASLVYAFNDAYAPA